MSLSSEKVTFAGKISKYDPKNYFKKKRQGKNIGTIIGLTAGGFYTHTNSFNLKSSQIIMKNPFMCKTLKRLQVFNNINIGCAILLAGLIGRFLGSGIDYISNHSKKSK